MLNSLNTERILKSITEGNSNAFREFYDLFYLKIYRFAGYLINSDELKEEIVSDVFFSIWQGRKNLPKIKNIEAYLYTITRNRALYYINQNARENVVNLDQLPIGFIIDHNTPEEITLSAELRDTLKKAVDDLPERCRLIFLMAKEEGLKYKEIAQILDISEKTINAQMVTAIRKLGEALRKYIYAGLAGTILYFLK